MKYRYRNEEEMKDSGIKLLGCLPKICGITKIKYVATITNGQVDPTKEPYSNMPHIGPENIEKYSGKILDYKLAHEENLTSGKYYFEKDEVLYGKINPQLGKVALASFSGICSADMYPLKSNVKKIIPKYLGYFMLSNVFFNQSVSFPARAGIPKINREELESIFIILPNICDQEKIANFLDKKTAQFDSIISKKEALIQRLEEAKKSLINEVVTGKVKVVKTSDGYELVKRKKEEMKNSGVEWLGSIPKYWQVKKIKHIASLKSGDSITAENIEENGNYPVYGGNGLRGYTSKYTHDGVYVLIGRQGALCGNINYAYNKFWASEHAVVVNPLIKFDHLWLGELLRSMNLNQYSVSAAQPGLAVGMIENLRIPFITLEEQKIISHVLNDKMVNIANVIVRTRNQIEKIKEAKQSLISEAVTGKIEILD